MKAYLEVQEALKNDPKTWLVTGVAGFIGSNLLETLLNLGQTVVGLDNFETGSQSNLDEVKSNVGNLWDDFHFIEGDIAVLADCQQATSNVDYILHQAALGSVPRSIKDPLRTNRANINGFINMLVAAKEANVQRFVYAASSSTYGDEPNLPKIEERIGNPLSPYAVTKYVNELYANVFARTYGIEVIGLRYFNVFGTRQTPDGAYAAVIPKWVGQLLDGQSCTINGDGETSRDFCYINNAVQANILAATTNNQDAINQVYNVAFGERTTLNDLYKLIRDGLSDLSPKPELKDKEAIYAAFRAGDVKHSLADIDKARRNLGYDPQYSVRQGLKEALAYYWHRHTTQS